LIQQLEIIKLRRNEEKNRKFVNNSILKKGRKGRERESLMSD
jgi:hypothetical protein